ncbi:MAG TPA: hypothetical protein EYG85_11610 [Crocinitomix sp.]|nr:hypothetical protein [Crocinitomix sp.]
MGLIIGGIVLIAIGVILWIVKEKKANKLNVLEINETSNANELIENYKSLIDSHGPGTFSIYAELKGKAVSETPQISEFGKKECVYYRSVVTREYEVLKTNRSSNGHTTKNWVRKSETISSNTNTSPDFSIKDETGKILIDSRGAELYTVKTFSKFEQGNEPKGRGLNISFGGFSISSGPSTRTIGFKYEEFCIPTNTDLYVIGDVNDRSGKLSISKPKDKKQPFIVSTKSEDELTGTLEGSVKGMKIAALISLILGGILVTYGAITKIIS